MRSLLLIFFNAFLLPIATAQLGCTDTQASNFDPLAIENDGSCIYPNTTYQISEIAILPEAMKEVSGLVYFEDQLWANLDAGNPDELYQIDTLTGAVLQKVFISNADNIDWEDLAQDDTHIYIGDFGNNIGNRTDLKIYKIPKSQLSQAVAFPEIISFTLSDQTDFSLGSNDHNYDLEAFFVHNDSIHLFSKNWQDFQTRHYTIANEIGEQTAILRDSLNVQGQITAADITDDGEIALLGYNTATSQVFLWLLFDFPQYHIFDGNKRKISLGTALNTSQTEALTFKGEGIGYIGAEEFSFLPPKLHRFSIEQWLNPIINELEEQTVDLNFSMFPNPAKEELNIRVAYKNADIEVSIFDHLGYLKFQSTMKSNALNIDLSSQIFPTGVYTIQLQSRNGVSSQQLIIK